MSSRNVLAEKGLDPTDPANVAALAVVVGAVMFVFGLLRFGSIMNFVSNAVMTGFSTGIALQTIAGVLNDATGYKPQSGNTIGKFVDALAHISLWHPAADAVAAGAVAAWAVFHFIKPLKSFAVLLALVVVTAVVAIAHIDVETVGDIATISNSLPPLSVPDFAVMPQLLVGGVAVALVALAQAAGISATVPNPDGSRRNMSGDFTAQGVGNLAGGFFGALPAGGSMSRTGIATSAGAQTSLVLYGVKAAQSAQLVGLQQTDGEHFEVVPVPAHCRSNDVTVLHYAGVGLFAQVARIDEEWPKVEDSTNAVVVLSMRMLPDVPSSVAIKALRRWAGELQAHGGRLIVAGVSPAAHKILERGGLVDVLGSDGIVPATDRVFGALDEAVARGRDWIASR